VNGTWACENADTLSEIKQTLGFGGWVMSDWGATYSTAPSALAGLDQQMPDATFFGAALAAAVASGAVPQSRVDDMVLRMLTPMYALGLIADPPTPARNASAPAQRGTQHAELARTLAMASIALLKNSGGLLPINPAALASVVVLLVLNLVLHSIMGYLLFAGFETFPISEAERRAGQADKTCVVKRGLVTTILPMRCAKSAWRFWKLMLHCRLLKTLFPM
jgi:beta-glucosidase